eukprot:TRINITY_DN1021_c0_g1_i1.p1 TRINITY_DN1021_c0_g1~~TRINITY_DN1021_c0_g1_i1.p1  ORF type:complete len:480 (-),score=152.08 TRINITY_DN1021_c0_g1_i1:60-1466(-)
MSDDDFNEDFDDGGMDDDMGDYGDADDFNPDDDVPDEDEDEPGAEVEVENQYYTSKDLEEESGIDAAINGFTQVLEKEKKHNSGKAGDWSFKALKKIIKLQLKKGDKTAVKTRFLELLKYNSAENGVSENDLYKGVGSILDHITNNATDTDFVLEMYDVALKQMKGKNENLWFKTKLRSAQRMFDKQMYSKLQPMIQELEESCLGPDGKEDSKKANQLLDVLTLAIQMYMDQKDRKKTKEVYEKGFDISKRNPGVLNSKLAVFHFVGGKLHMENNDWERAYTTFFDAFQFFEEAGSKFKVPCLKYLVLSNMLSNSEIDPFNSPETKNLQNNPEIKPMADLLDAYQHKEINKFEKILRDSKKVIMGDPFIQGFIQPVLREIRTQVLLRLITPYTRVTIPFIAKKLNVTAGEVQDLLVFLILNNAIEGQIDQIHQLLKIEKGVALAKYRHLGKWSDQLSSLNNSILGRVN